MSEVLTATVDQKRRVSPPPGEPMDLGGLAEHFVKEALAFCAAKLGPGAGNAALERLRNGDSMACGYYHYALARHIAAYVGDQDENVLEAFIYGYDGLPEDAGDEEETNNSPIHLIFCVRRKTAALEALLGALETILRQRCVDLTGVGRSSPIFDALLVEEADVAGRRGCGALLTGLHQRALSVWKRPTPAPAQKEGR